jgi:hypothetical protein
MITPTSEAYSELQAAYDFYNDRLYQSALPPCLMTLQRKSGRVFGYFSPARFDGEDGAETDELAMNPQHFRTRATAEVLSTLAHEMTHVWQAHFGKPGRGGYHNKEWGREMKRIGLHPSNTGEPGGKETGDQMTHYVIAGGHFDVVTRDFLASGFRFTWAEGDGLGLVPGLAGTDDPAPSSPKNKSNRLKYQCPRCSTNAWGKPGLNLVCGSCRVGYVPA